MGVIEEKGECGGGGAVCGYSILWSKDFNRINSIRGIPRVGLDGRRVQALAPAHQARRYSIS